MGTMQLERIHDTVQDSAARGWPGRACCCTAQPAVRVVLPPNAEVDHAVDLYLCGHHYRGARQALQQARAIVTVHDPAAVSW
jgi:hypothetical protein